MPTSKPKTQAAAPPAKRPANRPPHQPSRTDRATVSLMAAGGIAQADIARARGISAPTLRKHYRQELATGATSLNTICLIEHVKQIKAGNFHAIKWWQQARMGWSGHVTVDAGRPPGTPVRVIVELVGEAAPPRAGQPAPRSGPRLVG